VPTSFSLFNLRDPGDSGHQSNISLNPQDYGTNIVRDSSSGINYGRPLASNNAWSVSVTQSLKEWRGINLTISITNNSNVVQPAPFIRLFSGMYHKNWTVSQVGTAYRHSINYMNHDSYGMRSQSVSYSSPSNPATDIIGSTNSIYGYNWFAPCFTIDNFTGTQNVFNCQMMSVSTNYPYPFKIYGDFNPVTPTVAGEPFDAHYDDLKAFFRMDGNVNVPGRGILDQVNPQETRSWTIWLRYENYYSNFFLSDGPPNQNIIRSGTPTYRKIAALRSYEPYFAWYWNDPTSIVSEFPVVPRPPINGDQRAGPRVSGRVYGIELAGGDLPTIPNNERRYYLFRKYVLNGTTIFENLGATAPQVGQSYINPNTVSGWRELLDGIVDVASLKNNGYKAVLIINPAGWGNGNSGQNPAFFTNLPPNLRNTLSEIQDWENSTNTSTDVHINNGIRILFSAENVLNKVNLGDFNDAAIDFNSENPLHNEFETNNFNEGGLRNFSGISLFGIPDGLTKPIIDNYFENWRTNYRGSTLSSGFRVENKLISYMFPGYLDRDEFLKATNYSGSGSGWIGGRDWFLDLLTSGTDPWVYCPIKKWKAELIGTPGISTILDVESAYDKYVQKIESEHQAVAVTIGRIVRNSCLFPKRLNWKEKYETYTSIVGGFGGVCTYPDPALGVTSCTNFEIHTRYSTGIPSSLNYNMIGLYQATTFVDYTTDPCGQNFRFRGHSWIPFLGQSNEPGGKSGDCLFWLYDTDTTNPNSKLSKALKTIQDNINGVYDGGRLQIPNNYQGGIWLNWEPTAMVAFDSSHPPRVDGSSTLGGNGIPRKLNFVCSDRDSNGNLYRYIAKDSTDPTIETCTTSKRTILSTSGIAVDPDREIGVSIGDSLVMYYKNQAYQCNPSNASSVSPNVYPNETVKIRSLDGTVFNRSLRDWWALVLSTNEPGWDSAFPSDRPLQVGETQSWIDKRDIILQRRWSEKWTIWLKAICAKIKAIRPGVDKIGLYGSVPQYGQWAIDGLDFGKTDPESPDPDRELEWNYWGEWAKTLEYLAPSLYLWDPVNDYDAPYLYNTMASYGVNTVRRQQDPIQSRLFQLLTIRSYQDKSNKAGNMFIPFMWQKHLRDDQNLVNPNIMEFMNKSIYTSGGNGLIWWDSIGGPADARNSMQYIQQYWYPTVNTIIQGDYSAYITPRIPSLPLTNQNPVANAGPDATIQIQDDSNRITYILDGSGSYDPEGGSLIYQWMEVLPAGRTSSVAVWLTANNIVNPSVSLISGSSSDPLAGTYTFRLVVTDERMGSSMSDDVVINVNPKINRAPIPSAGPNQQKIISDYTGYVSVTLDGSSSLDPDGNITSYIWKEGSTTIATGVNPSVNFFKGQHTVTLTVTDNGDSFGNNVRFASSSVIVDVIPKANIPPTAEAGTDQNVTISDNTGHINVSLNGSSSHDNEDTGYNKPLTYSWTLNGVQISTEASPTISLVAGIYDILLTVTDSGDFSENINTRLTHSDSVRITVNPKPNIAPIANAGPDDTKTISDYTGSMNYTLDGSLSSDPDGYITLYKWDESIAGSIVHLTQSTSPTSLVNLSVGTHTIILTVTDNGDYAGAKKSNSDTVFVTINPSPNLPPICNTGNPQTVTDTDGDGFVIVTLDGSGSYDPNPHGSIISYLWKEGSTVLGSTSILSHSFSVGTHTATLTVTDNGDFYGLANLSTSKDVYITILPKPLRLPIANAGIDQEVTDTDNNLIENVQLDGRLTYDPDNNISSYVWKEGVTTIGTGSYPMVSFSIGTHTVTLTVTANDLSTTTDDVIIIVNPIGIDPPPPNVPPVANAGPDQLTVIDTDGSGSEIVTLDGSGSTDSDGTIANYHWTEIILGTRTTLATTSSSLVSYNFTVGTHVVTLVVTDNSGALSQGDDITITVNPKPNVAPTANAGPDQEVTDTDGSGYESVTLDGSASTDSDGTISSYSWILNEVEISTISNPTVSLPVGQNIIVLVVTDNQGLIGSDSVTINVKQKINIPPVANAGPDQLNLIDTDGDGYVSVTLDGSGSTDSDGTIVGYIWMEDESLLNTTPTASPSIFVCNFGIGIHHVTLKVVDDNGSFSFDFVDIYVFPRINHAPYADAGPDQLNSIVDTDGGGGEFVTLDGSGSNDNDDYPYGYIAAYNWSNNGSSIASIVNPIPYIEVGQHSIILTVTDNGGLTASDSVMISVSPKENEIPIANAGGNQTVTDTDGNGFVIVTLDGSGSYDPDGSVVTYSWMEDGLILSTISNPSINFTIGLHIVILIVTDTSGASSSDYIFINVNPKPQDPIPPVPGTGGGSAIGESQNFLARLGKVKVTSLGGSERRDKIEGFGVQRYTPTPSGSVGDSFPEDYSNYSVVAIANSIDGTIELSDSVSKYSKLEANIVNPSFKNVGMPHWSIEDTMEWVNSGMPSHLSQVHHSNIILSGIASEKIAPGLQESAAPSFQAKYIVPCNSDWYDKPNSTIDYNLSLDNGNVNLSIPYANCILSVPELNCVLVGGFGGVVSIDITTKNITKFIIDSDRDLLVKDIKKYQNTIYILDESKLYFYDITTGTVSNDTSVGLPSKIHSIISIFGSNISVGAEDGIYARKLSSSSWSKVVSTDKPVNVMSSPDAALAVSDDGGCYYSTDGFNWNKVGVISNKIVNKIKKHRSQILFATTNGLYQDGGSFYTKNISLQLLDVLNDIESSSSISVNDIDSDFDKAVIGLSDGRYSVYTDDFVIYSDSKMSNIHKVLILGNDIWLFSYNQFRIISESFIRKIATGTKI